MANQSSAGGSRKISFNVSDQYDIQDVIGEGAYGVVWSVYHFLLIKSRADLLEQFSSPQALRTESSHQENYPLRSQHVLLAYTTRNEIASTLQPREHHQYPRHPETKKLRDIQ